MGEKQLDNYTVEEYFKLSNTSLEKVEYWDGFIKFMSGGTINHGLISGNLLVAFTASLTKNSNKCLPINSEVKVYLKKHNSYFYPDMFIVCGDIEKSENENEAITNPTVIFEVLSDSTEAIDRGDKFNKYRSIESLKEYVLIDQKKALIEVYTKKKGNHIWQYKTYESLNETLHLESIEATISLTEIYKNVTFVAN